MLHRPENRTSCETDHKADNCRQEAVSLWVKLILPGTNKEVDWISTKWMNLISVYHIFLYMLAIPLTEKTQSCKLIGLVDTNPTMTSQR